MSIADDVTAPELPTAANQPLRRQILSEPGLDAQLHRDGIVKVDFAPPDVVRELIDIYHRHESGIADGYYATMMSNRSAYKGGVDVEIRDLLWGYLEPRLIDYEPQLGAFMIKHPSPNSEVAPHQDWMVVDETKYQSIACWIPATPITEEVGRMRYLPGSHRLFEGLRGSPTFPNQWHDVADRVRDELMVPIDIEVGQALIYDNRLLHATPPNRSEEVRVVAYINSVPVGSRGLHYYRDPEGTVQGYWVDGAFCTSFNIGDVPCGERFVEYPNYWVEPLSFEEIEERYREARAEDGVPA